MATTGTRDPRAGGSIAPGRQTGGGGTRRPKRRRRPAWLARTILTFQIIFILMIAVILGCVAGFFMVMKSLPNSITDIENYQPFGRTLIYSTDGILLANLFQQNRQIVSIDKIPKNLQNATVAIEDTRFYSDQGIDIRGIGRALFKDVHSGDMTAQGGSTITQQLVRNLGIGGIGHEKSIVRKVREVMLALKIERNYSKQQILEMYLNQVYYGSGAYGVQAAAQVYFGKTVDQLDLAQCAMIAGLVQRPSHLSPYVDKDAAMTRRDTVLGRMRDLGYITPDVCAQALSEPIVLAFPKPPTGGSHTFHAPYFVDYVVKQLSRRYGADFVYRGGLRVYTTLDWAMQAQAEQSLVSGIASAHMYGATQGALLAMDPKTGYIKAMVGGVDYAKSQFNIAADGRRQPGSSFKPIIYTAAIDSGLINEDTRILDEPITLPGATGPWSPKNDDGRFHGWVTAKEAVAQSINVPAVKVLREVGVDTAIHYAQMMGIKSPLSPYLTLALGSSAVTPLEMATMYSVIDNGGTKPTPIAVERIEQSDGTVVEDGAPELETTSITQDALRQVGDMLRDVITGGTAASIFTDNNPPDAHGKTGTTQSHLDVWFDGYTAKLVCTVWAGHPSTDPKTGRPIYGIPMSGGAWGVSVTAPIWKSFMIGALAIEAKEALKDAPKVKPAAVAKTTTTGQPASSDGSSAGSPSSSDTTTTAQPSDSTTDNSVSQTTNSSTKKTVTVWIDGTTGLRTTSDAPGAHQATFTKGDEPTEYDPATEPDGSAPVAVSPQSSSTTPSASNTSAPAASPDTSTNSDDTTAATDDSSIAAPAATGPKMVTVTICTESGLRATQWCPETIDRQYPVGKEPRGYCKIHKAPPGEP